MFGNADTAAAKTLLLLQCTTFGLVVAWNFYMQNPIKHTTHIGTELLHTKQIMADYGLPQVSQVADASSTKYVKTDIC